MRKVAQFIDTEYLFERSLIDSNVDPKLLNSSILESQEIHIQSILGNSLYTKMMADVVDEVITGEYLNLLRDYIQPALAKWAVYNVIPHLNYKLTNKNVAEMDSTFSKATELNNVKYLSEDARDKAEFFSQRIREYIMNHQSSFPEYFTTIGIDQIHPKRSSYFSGIYSSRNGNLPYPNDPDATIRIK